MPDAIERTTHHRRIAAGEARSVVLRCHYDAPIEDVWDACTDPERLRSWPLTRDGATLLALEHATVSTEVEWEGALLDPLPDVGDAWEHVLGTALRQHLRGESPAG